jgi:HlyD family secretion protein
VTLAQGTFVSAMDRPVARRHIARPAAMAGAVAAAGLAAAGWLTLSPEQRTLRVDATKITISTVMEAPFHDFVPLRGGVVPLNSVVLDAELGGRVEQVLVEAGQHVSAGQPLLRLSDPQLELDAIARETQVIEQMNAQSSQQLTFEVTKTGDLRAVADSEYNIVRLTRQVARKKPLAVSGFASQETLDQANDELAYAKRMREIAADALQRDAAVIQRTNALIEETAARLDADLAAAKHQLDALVVRAPANGMLTSLDAHMGEEKVRGQNLGQIDRDGGFKVTAQVDEFYLPRIRVGQRVTATFDGQPSTLVVAKLYPQVKDGRFEMDLAWDGAPPPGLRRGQTAQGKLEISDDRPALVLPAGPFLEASGGAWAFVVDRDGGGATRRPIKLGRRTAESVEVLSGLRAGERVVTSDYTHLDRIDRLAL